MPLRSMLVVQAWKPTPRRPAVRIISGREETFCFFIRPRIIAVPIPAICILESLSPSDPLGSIQPNILPMKDFFVFFRGSRSTDRPPKGKKVSPCIPEAAAPVAMIKAATALSRSLLKKMMLSLLPEAFFFRCAPVPDSLVRLARNLARVGPALPILRLLLFDHRDVAFRVALVQRHKHVTRHLAPGPQVGRGGPVVGDASDLLAHLCLLDRVDLPVDRHGTFQS